MNGTLPEPQIGQLWTDDRFEMRITEVNDTIVKMETRSDSGLSYTIVPRSLWPPKRFRYAEPTDEEIAAGLVVSVLFIEARIGHLRRQRDLCGCVRTCDECKRRDFAIRELEACL